LSVANSQLFVVGGNGGQGTADRGQRAGGCEQGEDEQGGRGGGNGAQTTDGSRQRTASRKNMSRKDTESRR
jgi:hypothetical protein